MRSYLHLEVVYDDTEKRWEVGVMSKWDDVIEIARSHQCGPFTGYQDVAAFLTAMWNAWCSPTLGHSASESLHDAYASSAP